MKKMTIQVRHKIFRRNSEHSEAFTCDQNVILAKLQVEAMEKKRENAMAMHWRLPGLLLYVYVLYITDTLSSHFGSL